MDINPLVMQRNFASYMKHMFQGMQDKQEVMLKELTNARLKQYRQSIKEKLEGMYGNKNKVTFKGFKSP